MRVRTRLWLQSAVLAATATNGLRPRRGQRAETMGLSLLLGWTASELPLVCALAQLVVHLRAQRHLGPLGRVVMGLLTPTLVVAFAFQFLEARRTRAIVETALDDAPMVTASASLPGIPNHPAPRWRALPLVHRDYTKSSTRNIAYGPDPTFHRLDIWRRPDIPTSQPTPVLIQIHGGGWMIGDNKTQALPLLAAAAEAGWTCVVPRYRLSPKATWPDQIVDVNTVIAWTKNNIERFGGDAGFVAITGGSAGGHLTSLAALASNHAEFKPGFERADTSVQVAVPFYGAYDWTDRDGTTGPVLTEFVARWITKKSLSADPHLFADASPRSWIHPDAPPFFVVHGDSDSLLSVEQARAFVHDLRSTSRSTVVYAELPHAEHAFDLTRSARTRGVIPSILGFLNSVYITTCSTQTT